MIDRIFGKISYKFKQLTSRDKDIEWFSIGIEGIFNVLNFYLLTLLGEVDYDGALHILVFLFVVAIILNDFFLLTSRYISLESRNEFDYKLYLVVYFLYGFTAISVNHFIFKDAAIHINLLFIGLVAYMVCDYINYMCFQKYKSKTFILLILTIIIFSTSLQDNTYNVAIAFILFILGLLDDDLFENLFGVEGKFINKTKLNKEKFLIVLILVEIFIAMLVGKYLIYLFLYYKEKIIEDMTWLDRAKYGASRFLVAAILISLTLNNFNKIFEYSRDFFKSRYVSEIEKGDTSNDKK